MTDMYYLLAQRKNQENTGYAYKFSVIMPVYNTEQYLEEAIESVVKQTIGFENIQLILVNNATEDGAGEICRRYRALYPDNVEYFELETNVGPSGARNEGKKLAAGKYINFMDSDDKWDLKAFETVWEFFSKNEGKIDCVACRMKMFEGSNGWHALDYRFNQSRVANILDEYDCLQLHVNTVFIYSSVIADLWFDLEMNHAEDTKFINLLILKCKRYGLLREAVYQYRKRTGENSLLMTVQKQKKYYSTDLEKSLGFFIQYSLEQYGYVIPYIQNMIAYTLKWRIKENVKCVLSPEAEKYYYQLISRYLKYVEAYIIFEQRNIFKEQKLFTLSLAKDLSVYEQIIYKDDTFKYKNFRLFKKDEQSIISIIIIKAEDNEIYLEGKINLPLKQDQYRVYVRDNLLQEYELEFFNLGAENELVCAGHVYHKVIGFKVKIPYHKVESLSFYMEYHGYQIGPLGMNFWFMAKLTKKINSSYFAQGKALLTYEKNTLYLKKNTFLQRLNCEMKVWLELLKKRSIRTACWRAIIFLGSCIVDRRRPIWLILDGFFFAGDNGEAFFHYVMEKKNPNIRPYFVLDRHSPDYERLCRIGPVIPADSKRYRLLFALSDKVISSQSFYNTKNTFYERTEILQDLFHFDFIYLQHGVIKDNHADTQSKHKKNFSMFITSAEKEKNSIVQGIGGNYYYDESVVKVTGLARHDALVHLDLAKRKKKILLAPTWRKEGMGIWNEKAQTYEKSETFRSTAFFRFYQRLMSDPRLLETMKQHEYYMTVRLHPRTMQQAEDFDVHDLVHIETQQRGYVKEIEETALLITDYSSIAFDYAYAYVPVVYTQFDVDTFYLNHAYTRGYFNYEIDGFGPVVYDYDSTVQAIIAAIEKNCVMEEKYKKRVDEFFAFRDGKNCERIYQEILNMDKERGE